MRTSNVEPRRVDSAAQAALPDAVQAALGGTTNRIASIYSVGTGLLAPIGPEPPPTESSVVTNFHRCKVWFPFDPGASRAHWGSALGRAQLDDP
jgi:hypothetical protein